MPQINRISSRLKPQKKAPFGHAQNHWLMMPGSKWNHGHSTTVRVSTPRSQLAAHTWHVRHMCGRRKDVETTRYTTTTVENWSLLMKFNENLRPLRPWWLRGMQKGRWTRFFAWLLSFLLIQLNFYTFGQIKLVRHDVKACRIISCFWISFQYKGINLISIA